jgi:hypothetical protein
LDDSFAGLVRGPSTTYPRGFPLLFPVWFAVVFAAVWIAWLRVIGPMPLWYAGTLVSGLLIAGTTVSTVLMTIRHPAFRADRNGIRLGLRTERKRPRNRQAHLWWSDVRQLRIEPRRYGLMVEISLGPAARILRRRGLVRQALLWCGMLLLPFCLGRGTPRLTEPRRKDPQYRVRLYDVTPEELGLALAELALPAVEIIVISRRDGPVMARRPQQAARRPPARSAAALPAAVLPAPSAAALPAAAPRAAAPAVTRPPAATSPMTARPTTVRAETVTAALAPSAAEPPAPARPAPEQPAAASSLTDEPPTTTESPATAEAPATDEAPATAEAPAIDEPPETAEASVTDEPPETAEASVTDEPPETAEASVTDEPRVTDEASVTDEPPGTEETPPTDEPPVTDEPPAVEVPMMASAHVGLEVAATAQREASKPAA